MKWIADLRQLLRRDDALVLRCSTVAYDKVKAAAAKSDPIYPNDCVAMKVNEFAAAWGVSEHHVLDLILEGSLLAFDIGGCGHEFIRIRRDAIPKIAKLARLSEETIFALIQESVPAPLAQRTFWRIARESWNEFVARRRSLPPGTDGRISSPKQRAAEK